MEQIKQTTLKKAIVLLNAIGVQYAIIDLDGNKHGNLEIVGSRKRKPRSYAHGELSNYCRTHFKEMQVGDVQTFPTGNYPIAVMQRTLSSWICKKYGNGAYTTCINKDRKSIEILRIV